VTDLKKDLGRLVAVYPIAPAYLQRAVFIVVLSFVFFLAMMFVFYVRQTVVYFLLASAFLLLYLVTLFSFVMQRRSHVEVFANGLKYKKNVVAWADIAEVKVSGEIILSMGEQFTIPKTINNHEAVLHLLRRNANLTG